MIAAVIAVVVLVILGTVYTYTSSRRRDVEAAKRRNVEVATGLPSPSPRKFPAAAD